MSKLVYRGQFIVICKFSKQYNNSMYLKNLKKMYKDWGKQKINVISIR